MSTPLTEQEVNAIEQYDEQQRFNYLLKQAITNQELWILTDEHGCVMLNSEDEDCVPVWPNQEFAQSWATNEWQACQAQAISLDKWLSHWSPGLEEDELAIVVFPNQAEEGLVIYPYELESELKHRLKKK
ncbi:DUF2750 domain-containing protein [Thalassomonas haliotis]|uniref:DUF2750 domain-containing protein n=1 Tax=Thalassomonas haliotis TaxID=485448 RepID=A0ABY7VI67_9GAMM|nr:DUF2750 domain-containing protein [Thalassomonas haliotis]WDE13430.1 DUF2750 domain-containing protein [Thalassomonas haliotis]